MPFSESVGWAAMLITVAYTCLGLPAQIRKNADQKSTQGLSLFMNVMLLFTFSIWVVYGFTKRPIDWFIVASNFPGALCIIVILFQFWKFRPRIV